ncbi:MAG: anaerobic ribonucleoside-triphosphate reductase activating protein [Lachnospiraceae bacterium]|nr:anaerobic ribonucleoside-triphosphate reductase activating protein [Lachnospiraceae bacterium]
MKIHGLQKMTLLDYPGHVACTVFLSGCDFRCPFCHNYELAVGTAPSLMEEEEFFSFLSTRRGLLDGVAITGGEPCLRPSLPGFLRKIKEMGYAVKLDTNGAHPDLLRLILEEGLADYVAMDIKNSPEKYALTCGLSELDLTPIRESVSLLMSSSVDYEFRTTAVAELHEENDFEEIGKWIRGAKHYFLQAFTDREQVPFDGLHAPDRESLLHFQQIAEKYISDVKIRGTD